LNAANAHSKDVQSGGRGDTRSQRDRASQSDRNSTV